MASIYELFAKADTLCRIEGCSRPRIMRPGGKRRLCEAHFYARHKTAKTATSDQRATRQYRYRYGITLEDYEAMLERQDGGCAICGRPPQGKRLSVDHNHSNGRVRGLLCVRCNSAVGLLDDDPTWSRRAEAYLCIG